MKVKILGISHVFGTSYKNPNNPRIYDMHQLVFLTPIENVETEKYNCFGFGYQSASENIEKNLFLKLQTEAFPFEGEIISENVPTGRGMKTIIRDVKNLSAKVA